MDPLRPLLVFDSNVLFDVWLGRRDDAASYLLVEAEQQRVELEIPEYVLLEFRGSALQCLREELMPLEVRLRELANCCEPWKISLADDALRKVADLIPTRILELHNALGDVERRFRSVAAIKPHTPEIHVKGDLRQLSGRPPDAPGKGLKDCRIYEAVLEIAHARKSLSRPKYLVTSDSDFDYPELVAELQALDFEIARPGPLYGLLLRKG